MPKQIKVGDVVDRVLKAGFARAFALTFFTQPDAQYYYGVFNGIDMTLRMLFTKEELDKLVKERFNDVEKIKRHPWATKEAMIELYDRKRVELAKEGMDATKDLKMYEKAAMGQKQLVTLITDLLKRWEPGDAPTT